ncbi:MAG: ABC transporter permease, partial [Bacteroidaceae bacterium]|nr:ABC transporter permease [Bacteroidaceae bacterium]
KPCFIRKNKDDGTISNCLIFKYHPGTWETLKEKFAQQFKEMDIKYTLKNVEAEYENLLRSEKNLQLLLGVTTGTCILIALFGVWSMIMLTCEQRRKEIAIRKVHGATVKDILDMFFLEYMALQAVAAAVAFPIGYACMKPWLEQYVVQTEISWWIYVSIFLLVALLVALCIGWRVWKTATARPADEICKG